MFFVRVTSCRDSRIVTVFFADGYAPEVFPTPSRGTGDALAAAASRITGIFAPVIAVRCSMQSIQPLLTKVNERFTQKPLILLMALSMPPHLSS